jgi:hypothetical protein
VSQEQSSNSNFVTIKLIHPNPSVNREIFLENPSEEQITAIKAQFKE